jgi:predicted MPP superfamily phosphohydrolase
MPLPSFRLVFFATLGLYLALQAFLFLELRGFLLRRYPARANFPTLLAALFFLLLLYPFAWHVVFGVADYEPHTGALRPWATVWALGSTGTAVAILAARGLRRLKRRRGGSSFDLSRRNFLAGGARALAAAPFAVSGYGVFHERRRFEVETFEVPIAGLSSALDRLTIVQLTDIHVGPFMPEEEVEAFVEAANRLEPDFVALTGDFVSFRREEVLPCARALGKLRARRGIYACLGNHDFYTGAEDELAREMERRGIVVLRNRGRSMRIGNSSVGLVGIEDLRTGEPDLAGALAEIGREPDEIRVLLSHRPEIFPEAARRGVDLVLAGHYHGGQVKPLPGSDVSLARLLTRYAEGMFQLPRSAEEGRAAKLSTLFVSRGVGITALPVRINCPPQIAHLVLRKA